MTNRLIVFALASYRILVALFFGWAGGQALLGNPASLFSTIPAVFITYSVFALASTIMVLNDRLGRLFFAEAIVAFALVVSFPFAFLPRFDEHYSTWGIWIYVAVVLLNFIALIRLRTRCNIQHADSMH